MNFVCGPIEVIQHEDRQSYTTAYNPKSFRDRYCYEMIHKAKVFCKCVEPGRYLVTMTVVSPFKAKFSYLKVS